MILNDLNIEELYNYLNKREKISNIYKSIVV